MGLLYAKVRTLERRLALLQQMTPEAAESLAAHVLASEWRPRTDTPEAA